MPIALPHGYRAPIESGSLTAFLKPDLTPPELTLAKVEGWILGIPGMVRERDLDREGILPAAMAEMTKVAARHHTG
jgi:hypothetical protein